ncbi:MAG: UvrB/UvrC motif-containing protein [Tissierellia bacterium]|nr:UvrB/UvrC motif-containing protein [Tissierellia bacterium]
MKCEKCGKPATIEIIITIGEKNEHLNLCFECYSEIVNSNAEKITDGEFKFFDDVLSDLLSSVIVEEDNLTDYNDTVCPRCGYGIGDIVNSGKFGCDSCFSTFYDKVLQILQSTQGSQNHMGNHPQRYDEVEKILSEIQENKNELEDSVLKEDYEKAAKIRDEIQRLNKKLEIISGEINE